MKKRPRAFLQIIKIVIPTHCDILPIIGIKHSKRRNKTDKRRLLLESDFGKARSKYNARKKLKIIFIKTETDAQLLFQHPRFRNTADELLYGISIRRAGTELFIKRNMLFEYIEHHELFL